MKDKDYNMLQECYSQVSEAIYPPNIMDSMKKAKQLLSSRQPVDSQTQSVIAQDPRSSSSFVKMAVDLGITSNLRKHIEQSVWDTIKTDDYTKRELEGWLNKHNLSEPYLLEVNPEPTETPNKPTISGLAQQDPREVEGYGKTYGEAHDINMGNFKGKEWHGMGKKMPEGPSMGDLIKAGKEMQDVNLGGGMKKSMPVHSLANSIIDALDEHGDVNYKDLAVAVAKIFKHEYESTLLPADKFLKAIKVALGL